MMGVGLSYYRMIIEKVLMKKLPKELLLLFISVAEIINVNNLFTVIQKKSIF